MTTDYERHGITIVFRYADYMLPSYEVLHDGQPVHSFQRPDLATTFAQEYACDLIAGGMVGVLAGEEEAACTG